jgi:transcriptional regulator with XRE-family HTH domain
MQIGKRIRKIRRQHAWTLQQVADKCGFSKSLLSKIENGHTVPPVATLTKIGRALGVDVSVLVDDSGTSGTVLTTAEDTRTEAMTSTDKGYRFLTIASKRTDKLMQPYIFEGEPGKVKHHTLTHDGEEFLFVLEGILRYRVGDVEYRLRPGDSLYFDAHEEHELIPESGPVRCLAVFGEDHRLKQNG